MATISYGPGLAPNAANTSPTGIFQTLMQLNYIYPTVEQSTVAWGDYRALGEPGLQNEFIGTGFTYNSTGYPIGGTVTEVRYYSNGALVWDLSGISVPVTTIETWASYDEAALAGATVFSGTNTLYGSVGNDVLDGYNGNSTFYPSSGSDTLIGGTGIDTVVLADFLRQNQIVGLPTGSATITGPSINDNLTSIDRLQFIDGTMYYDGGSPAAEIARLYQAALDRAPDPLGTATWDASMLNGTTLLQVADSFIASPEFQARFPGASQSPTAFVTQLYANVLHRAPDATGLAYWGNQLQSGAQSQAQVLVGFSESTENYNATLPLTGQGIWVANEQTASVARLYYATLNRAPDASGLSYWATQLQSGAQSLIQEAGEFTGSAEFQIKYGSLSNSDFVSLLYSNVLDRGSDATGLAYWANQLQSGSTRAGVVLGFSQSSENEMNLAPRIETSGITLAS